MKFYSHNYLWIQPSLFPTGFLLHSLHMNSSCNLYISTTSMKSITETFLENILVSYTNCFFYIFYKKIRTIHVYVNCSGPVFVINPMFCMTESQAVSYRDLPPAHNSALKIQQLTCTSIMHDLSEPIKAYKLLISIDVNMNGMYCVIQLVNQ